MDFEKLRDHYKRCKALIFPGVEDFGIVPLEVMASGRPVIAYARGGALETVVSKETGVFFHEQTPESVQGAIVDFEQEIGKFSSSTIRNHAGKFSQEKFARAFSEFVDDKLKNRNVKAD